MFHFFNEMKSTLFLLSHYYKLALQICNPIFLKHQSTKQKFKKVSLFSFLQIMEAGAISEREWISLSGAYTAEESDFMANLLNNYCIPNELNSDLTLEIPSSYWASSNEPSYYSSDASDSSNIYALSQPNNNLPYTFNESNPLWMPNNGASSLSLDFSVEDVGNADCLDDNGSNIRKTRQCSRLQQSPADSVVNGKSSQQKRRADGVMVEEAMRDDKVGPVSVENASRKRPQSLLDVRIYNLRFSFALKTVCFFSFFFFDSNNIVVM